MSDNYEKGLQYEKYVKNFIIQNLGKNAYLWNECPENVLIQNGLISSHNHLRLLRKDMKEGHLHSHKDIGIDIIQIENVNDDIETCSIVQCKNGYHKGLCIDHIAGIMARVAFLRDINSFIYYTSHLSKNIHNIMNNSQYVVYTDHNNLSKLEYQNKIHFVQLPYENNIVSDIPHNTVVPYKYQLDAVSDFKQYFQDNNRGILSLPCGCGKTYTSYMIAQEYDHIIILSPLREFASQNLNKFVEYGYDKNKTMLVDTDGIRDANIIKKFINANKQLLISCTYDSMDIISDCLNHFKNALFIIDEFHNLSKANICNNTNPIYKLLVSNCKILFMSATPRIYDIEYDDEEFDTDELFGEIVYKMDMGDAITKKFICDYKIWLPVVHENNEELDRELSIFEIDNEMKNRCKFLYSCILNNGSRKCIVYCKDTDDMKSMMNCMQTLDEFYITNIEINGISCKDSEKIRKEHISKFSSNNENIQLLFNIKILNECIDIPACDSVYISYPSNNKITTIQRICRANRIDKMNAYKIANVYIWCNEYGEILQTLSSIKEYDAMFKDKIKINEVNFFNNKNKDSMEIIEKDKKLLDDYTLGVKEYKMSSWDEKLEMVQNYIDNNNKLPCILDKSAAIKTLGLWVFGQKQNYKYNLGIFKKQDIVQKWEAFVEKHHELLKSEEEIWKDNLDNVSQYIAQHNRLPSSECKDVNITKLGRWVLTQKANYKNKRYNMKQENIKKLWEEFVEQHSKLFRNNEEKWNDYLNSLELYVNEYNKLPSDNDKDPDLKKLAKWTSEQRFRYKKKTCIMKFEHIREKWLTFTSKHYEHFRSNEEVWRDKLLEADSYIVKNQKLPYLTDPDPQVKHLCKWLYHQSENYKVKKEGLANQELRSLWEEFIKKHPCKKFGTK
jgi:superfamily II DNA or RNA helicase